jgi:hypothetical protein
VKLADNVAVEENFRVPHHETPNGAATYPKIKHAREVDGN